MQAKPNCPRCGYDLEGLIATWTESCPMRSTCSECGLEFECSRALSPHLIGPRWSYEHGFTPEMKRWWATSGMALSPRRMFRELAVDHRINPRRLVRFIVIWVLTVHVATALMGLVLMFFAMGGFVGSSGFSLFSGRGLWTYTLPRLAFPYNFEYNVPTGPMSSRRAPLTPLFLLVYVPTLLMPLWTMLLGTSLRMARVRKVHLLRGLAYSLPCAAAYVGVSLAMIIGVPMARAYLTVNVPPLLLPVLPLVCVGHHLAWWYLFIRRYLRLRHAAAVVFLHTVMNVLVVLIVMVLVANWGMRF